MYNLILLPNDQIMKATLTLDFSDRLNPDEQRELLAETLHRQIPLEDILVEALRLRREQRFAAQLRNEQSDAIAA